MFKMAIEKFLNCFKKKKDKNIDVEKSLEKIIEILNFYRK